MDKRQVAILFRNRLRQLIASEKQSTATFLRDTGMDRSALSQFLDDGSDRLPRAEALRRIAEARGVSVDWLLGLENAPEGRQVVTSSVQIEQMQDEHGTSPLEHWRAEAWGHKLRYVPSTLPDMLSLANADKNERIEDHARAGGAENVLEGLMPGDLDIEIAMPIQTLEDLAQQTGLFRNAQPEACRRQLQHMARICKTSYPTLRLHLYDGTTTFSAPFTVYGKLRVAIYIGESYLVITAREQIISFVHRFDELVRRTLISPDQSHETLQELSESVKG
ncbi:MAG: transcriptional regulator [Rhodothermales bacterium]|nr:transcriptional regulator [Rhodothermales bacterium]